MFLTGTPALVVVVIDAGAFEKGVERVFRVLQFFDGNQRICIIASKCVICAFEIVKPFLICLCCVDFGSDLSV